MIQSLELDYFANEDMFCIFCGEQILSSEESPTPCGHVLFIAHDIGYEHESTLVSDILPPFDDSGENADEDDDKFFVDPIKELSGFPADSFIIESYAPAPSFFGLYLGLSPSTP
jgi:hypothetical protein